MFIIMMAMLCPIVFASDPRAQPQQISLWDSLDLNEPPLNHASASSSSTSPLDVSHDVAYHCEVGPQNATGRKRRSKSDVIFESCNGTSWTAIRERLLYSRADVILAQEHRLLMDDINDKSSQVRDLGWKAIWAPALATDDSGDRRSTTGGVAIFARKYLGLTHLEEDGVKIQPLEEARLVAARFTAPGLGSIVLYSGYFECGAGLNAFNKDMITKLRRDTLRHGQPWICAADWNFEPGVIGGTDIPSLIAGKVRAPVEPTCITPSTAHILDYFLVSDTIAAAAKAPVVIDEATTKPHKPVQMAMTADLCNAMVPKFKDNQRLPTEAVVGPRREPQSYDKALASINMAKMSFSQGVFDVGMDHFARAFAEWAVPAELEVAHASDTMDLRKSSRACKPRKRLVPLVPDRLKDKETPKLGRLSGALQCLQHVSAKMARAWRVGNSCWASLTACVARACTYTQQNVEIDECESLKDKVAAHLQEVLAFAAESGHTSPNGPPWMKYTQLNCTAAAIRKDITSSIADERSKLKKAKDVDWDNWRNKELEGYGSGAHRFTKVKTAWQPPQVRDAAGNLVADSKGILEIEADKYKSLWKANAAAPVHHCANNVPCAKLGPQRLRRTSKSFKKRTGVAPDGWHPRHFALLSDQGLDTLDELYQVLEICGHLPTQQAQVYIFFT